MTDLDQLIEAVEAGAESHVVQIFAKRLSSSARDRGDYWPSHDVEKAYHGSLDAAKALHEELLDSGFHAELWESCTRPRAMVRRVDEEYVSWSDNTARAWLLSILKAYRSQQ